MKTFILALGLSISFLANADVAEVNARKVTCTELNQSLDNYGTLIVKSRFLGIPATTTVNNEPVNCGIRGQNINFIVGTKDVKNCHAGYVCEVMTIERPCRRNTCF
jgi:hypothetical protein